MNMSIWVFLFVGLIFFVIYLLPRATWISPASAKGFLSSGGVLIDVRSQGEFQNACAAGAIHIPVGEIVDGVNRLKWKKEKPLIVYCASGSRASIAKLKLKKAGYTTVFNLGTLGRAMEATRS